MANGSLSIRHNFSGETNKVIMRWYKSTAPGSEVGRVVYDAPHSEKSYIIQNLQPVWYLIEFWRSADGTTLDELLLTLAGNARLDAVYPVERFEYVVDRGDGETDVWADPVQDDIGIRDTRLLNAYYWVEERGTGSLLSTEIVDRSDDGGGFDFTEDGKVMNEDGVYIVTAITKVDVFGDSGSGATAEDGAVILTTNQDYVHTTMNGRLLVANWASQVGTLVIPNLAIVPDTRFKLQTHQGTQRNVVIQFDTGDTVWFRGEQVNKITLGKNEDIELMIQDNVAYVYDLNTFHYRLGERIYADLVLANTLPQDGTLLVLANYPRVAELIDKLPAGAVISNDTLWNTSSTVDGVTVYVNKGKWMSDGTNFRTPDLRNLAIKSMASLVAGTPGGDYDHQKMLDHFHALASGTDGGSPYMSEAHSTGGNLGYDLNGGSAEPLIYRSGVPRDHTSGSAIGAASQKINSVLLYPLVCI